MTHICHPWCPTQIIYRYIFFPGLKPGNSKLYILCLINIFLLLNLENHLKDHNMIMIHYFHEMIQKSLDCLSDWEISTFTSETSQIVLSCLVCCSHLLFNNKMHLFNVSHKHYLLYSVTDFQLLIHLSYHSCSSRFHSICVGLMCT